MRRRDAVLREVGLVAATCQGRVVVIVTPGHEGWVLCARRSRRIGQRGRAQAARAVGPGAGKADDGEGLVGMQRNDVGAARQGTLGGGRGGRCWAPCRGRRRGG